MQNQSCSVDKTACQCGKRYSWFPVIMGGLIGVGLAFLLNLFSIAIGLSVFTTSAAGAKMIAVGGVAGMMIAVIASTYTSGLVAGYLSGHTCCGKNLGVVYGFAAWCFSLILMVLLASAIGTYVTAYADFVGQPKIIEINTQVQSTTQQTAKSISNKVNPTVTADSTNAEKDVKAMGLQSLVIFLLFFVGAFSSSFGGYVGYECWRKCKQGY